MSIASYANDNNLVYSILGSLLTVTLLNPGYSGFIQVAALEKRSARQNPKRKTCACSRLAILYHG